MTIRSNPPGAMVYIDDQQIGTTPVSTDFLYYGTRKIRLVKDRFETLTTYQKIAPPWYQIPPFDFVSENLVGREIRDERVLDFQMQPQRIVPKQELLNRAQELRAQATGGFVSPIPNGVQPAQAVTPLVQPPAGVPTFNSPSVIAQ
ncbi:MAG: PEGA domain-containing protein [Planctomycetota bacterium]